MRLIQAIVWRVICVGLLAAGVAAFYLDLSTAYTVLASRLPDNTALRWSLGVALILVALIGLIPWPKRSRDSRKIAFKGAHGNVSIQLDSVEQTLNRAARKISEALTGDFYNAVSGAEGERLYLSVEEEGGGAGFYCYDTARGIWHREDDTRAAGFGRAGGTLYYAGEDGYLYSVSGEMSRYAAEGTAGMEEPPEYLLETHAYGQEITPRKLVRKLMLRAELPEEGSTLDIFVKYDEGNWILARRCAGQAGSRGRTIPVSLRRCDHFRLRLEGRGPVKLQSLAMVYSRGTERS